MMTDCPLCDGTGALAVFYAECSDSENGTQRLTFKGLTAYGMSREVWMKTAWTRYFYRCSCALGDSENYDQTLPKWRDFRTAPVIPESGAAK